MSTTELKELIHKRIDNTEDELLLQQVNDLLGSNGDEYELVPNAEIDALLEERMRKLKSGESESMSLEEFQEKIKMKYGYEATKS